MPTLANKAAASVLVKMALPTIPGLTGLPSIPKPPPRLAPLGTGGAPPGSLILSGRPSPAPSSLGAGAASLKSPSAPPANAAAKALQSMQGGAAQAATPPAPPAPAAPTAPAAPAKKQQWGPDEQWPVLLPEGYPKPAAQPQRPGPPPDDPAILEWKRRREIARSRNVAQINYERESLADANSLAGRLGRGLGFRSEYDPATQSDKNWSGSADMDAKHVPQTFGQSLGGFASGLPDTAAGAAATAVGASQSPTVRRSLASVLNKAWGARIGMGDPDAAQAQDFGGLVNPAEQQAADPAGIGTGGDRASQLLGEAVDPATGIPSRSLWNAGRAEASIGANRPDSAGGNWASRRGSQLLGAGMDIAPYAATAAGLSKGLGLLGKLPGLSKVPGVAGATTALQRATMPTAATSLMTGAPAAMGAAQEALGGNAMEARRQTAWQGQGLPGQAEASPAVPAAAPTPGQGQPQAAAPTEQAPDWSVENMRRLQPQHLQNLRTTAQTFEQQLQAGQLPNDQIPHAIETIMSSRLTDHVLQTGEDGAAHWARIAEGGFTQDDLKYAFENAAKSGAVEQSPNGFLQFMEQFQNMDPANRWAMIIGLPLGLIGIAQMLGGEGGLGALVMSMLGIGAAGYGAYQGNLGGLQDAINPLLGKLGLGEHVQKSQQPPSEIMQPPQGSLDELMSDGLQAEDLGALQRPDIQQQVMTMSDSTIQSLLQEAAGDPAIAETLKQIQSPWVPEFAAVSQLQSQLKIPPELAQRLYAAAKSVQMPG